MPKMLTKVFQLSKYPASDFRTLRSNIRAHILDGSLFLFAMSFISVNTILPVFIQQIGGGAIAIGSVPVIWTIGLNLPQAILIRFTHPVGQIQPAVLRYGLLHRSSFLVIGIVTLAVVGRIPATLSVPLLLTLIFLAAVTGSLGVPPWFHLFSKTTPVDLRGKLLAFRQLCGSSLGILGGFIVTAILSILSFPLNFASLFVLAFLLMMCSFYYLTVLAEPESEPVKQTPERSGSIVNRARVIFERDKIFRNFLLADAFTLMSMTASSFYAVYAIQEFNLIPSFAGTFTVIVMASMAAGNIVFGFLPDAFGHKWNLMLLAGASAAASLVAATAGNVLVYGLAFFFMAWTLSIQGISRLSFVAELCSESDRPVYIALLNSMTAPTVAVGIFFGWVAREYGFPLMFGLSFTFGLLAVLWLYFAVPDPRSLRRRGVTGLS